MSLIGRRKTYEVTHINRKTGVVSHGQKTRVSEFTDLDRIRNLDNV